MNTHVNELIEAQKRMPGALLASYAYADKKGSVYINRQQVCTLLNISECHFHRLKRTDPSFPVKSFYNGRDHYLLDDVLSYKANR